MAWNEPGGNGNHQDPWSGGGRGGGGGGGRGDQGPPDLDEALRKLQEKLNGIFGGGGGKRGGGGTPAMGFGLLGLVLFGVAVIWGVMGVYTVDQQERGVVLRLGKYYETVNPGLQWNPPLVDNVQKVNVTKVRSYDHRALMLTEDENIVEVGLTVQYFITNPGDYVLRVRDPDTSLAHATESALRHVVGTSEMHSVLTEGREVMGSLVAERLQRYMDDYGTGLQISQVNIENTQAPSQVQAAFDDVIKAREDEQRVMNEAQSYANGIIPEARGQAQRQLEEANAYREEVVARAQGESQRFVKLLAEYEKAPQVTRERIYLDAMESVLSASSKVLMDVKQGNSLMYLPLDKLMQGSSQQPGQPARQLDEEGIQSVTDQVVEQLRRRQSSRREGR